MTKFCASHGNRKAFIHMSLPLSSILNQMIPTSQHYILFDSILLTCLELKLFSSQTFRLNICTRFSFPFAICLHALATSYASLRQPDNIFWELQSMQFLIAQYYPSSCCVIFLDTVILLNIFFQTSTISGRFHLKRSTKSATTNKC